MQTTALFTSGLRSSRTAPLVDRLDHRVAAQMGTQPHGVILRAAAVLAAVAWVLPEL